MKEEDEGKHMEEDDGEESKGLGAGAVLHSVGVVLYRNIKIPSFKFFFSFFFFL